MGEAKQRKNRDPLYGKKPKGGRGIMMVPRFFSGNNSNEIEAYSFLALEQVRFGLLFWDQIAWPLLPFPERDDGELSILNDEDILIRPLVDFKPTSLSVGKCMADAYFRAYLNLEESRPGCWSLSAESESDIREFVNNKILLDRGVSVSLHRAIPIPSKDAPLQDILEFKLKRASELMDLRDKINEFSAVVSSSKDNSLELANQVDKIDRACAELLRVTKETRFPIRLSSMSFTSEISGSGILGLGTVASQFDMNSVGGFLTSIGLVGMSALKITSSYSHRNNLVKKSPFKYIPFLHEEIDWQ